MDRVCKKNIWTKRRWREGGREYSVSGINVVNGNIERESFVERMWKMWRTSLFFKWCVTGEEDIDCSVVELESRDIWRIVFHSKLDHEKLFSSIHLELLKQSTCRDARWLFEKFKEEAQIFVSFLPLEVYLILLIRSRFKKVRIERIYSDCGYLWRKKLNSRYYGRNNNRRSTQIR